MLHVNLTTTFTVKIADTLIVLPEYFQDPTVWKSFSAHIRTYIAM